MLLANPISDNITAEGSVTVILKQFDPSFTGMGLAAMAAAALSWARVLNP